MRALGDSQYYYSIGSSIMTSISVGVALKVKQNSIQFFKDIHAKTINVSIPLQRGWSTLWSKRHTLRDDDIACCLPLPGKELVHKKRRRSQKKSFTHRGSDHPTLSWSFPFKEETPCKTCAQLPRLQQHFRVLSFCFLPVHDAKLDNQCCSQRVVH